MEENQRTREKLQAREYLVVACGDLDHQKCIQAKEVARLQDRVNDLESHISKRVHTLGRKRTAEFDPRMVDASIYNQHLFLPLFVRKPGAFWFFFLFLGCVRNMTGFTKILKTFHNDASKPQ